MKRVLFALLMVPFAGIAQKKDFNINGSVSGIANNSLVYVTDANNPTDTIAHAIVKNNSFVLKGTLAEPGLVDLNFASAKKKDLLFLDNSNITISGNSDDIQKLKVDGSPSNKDFHEYQEIFNPLFTKLTKLGEQAKQAGTNSNVSAQAITVIREVQDNVDKFLKSKKESYVSPFLILVTAQLSDDIKLLETRYNGLAANIKQSFYGKYVNDAIAQSKQAAENDKIGAVGTDAIEFTQNDPSGKPVSLSSFKGKYVLIDFWASWCGPCRMENPNVVSTYNKYKNKNFTVLGISLDKTRDSWLQAIKDDNLTWTHVSDLQYWNNAVAQKYKVQGIPKNYLIDPNGKIIARDLRGPQLSQKLEELLK